MTNKYLEKIAALNFPMANVIRNVTPVKGIANTVSKGGVKGSVFGKTLKPESMTKVAKENMTNKYLEKIAVTIPYSQIKAMGMASGLNPKTLNSIPVNSNTPRRAIAALGAGALAGGVTYAIMKDRKDRAKNIS